LSHTTIIIIAVDNIYDQLGPNYVAS